MSAEAGFIKALKECPTDNETRLVYSDWLEEHGRLPEAEFLRLLLAYQACEQGYSKNFLAERIIKHPQCRLLGGHIKGDSCHLTWTLSADEFLNPALSDRLAVCGRFFKVSFRELCGRLQEIANSKHFSYVTDVAFTSHEIGQTGAAILAGSKHVSGLESLNLRGNRIGDAGVAALVGSPRLSNLVRLELGGNELSDQAAVTLAGAPHLPRLIILGLGSNEIGNPGAIALAGSTNFPNLLSLDVYDNNNITRGGKRALTLMCKRAVAAGRPMDVWKKWDGNAMPGDHSGLSGSDKWSQLIRISEPRDRLTAGIS